MAKKDALPTRLRRSESFLGIHFDFHARHDCTEVGKRVTRRMVEKIVEQVAPDFIQCDCKGHPGISSYPTEVGHPAPGFVRDQLRIWRDVTAQYGVSLYMHYSGVIDEEAVKRHPSWAVVDAAGKRHARNTSVFGPYVDKLMIPQLKELCDEYDVDGVWVDGDCWAMEPDYSKRALAEFRRRTGIRSMPRDPRHKDFPRFLEFCRQGFREYVRHYVDALHEHRPNFQIASNWAYSAFMPEPVGIGVDYLSGDYSMQNSVNAARFQARCLAPQARSAGKPWDLMAWSFSGHQKQPGRSTKTVAQLQQEAAVVLSLGGGFQAYFKQKRDGSIHDWTMGLMAAVAKFCRERQAVCHRAVPVPQVALLYSGPAFYRQTGQVFRHWDSTDAMQGVLNALLDNQYSVEILGEHHLQEQLSDYPIIVIPEWGYLRPSFTRRLLAYVRGGGSLLCIGPRSAAMLRKELRVRAAGKPARRTFWISQDGWLGGSEATVQNVKLGRGARAVGSMHGEDDPRSESDVAASIARLGKGRIAATYFDIGERYLRGSTAVTRDFLGSLVRELFPSPIAEIRGSRTVDVVVNRKDGKLCVNLLNTSGPHAHENTYTFDEIPPVGPLHVTIRTRRRPRRIRVHPTGESVRFTFRRGEAQLTLRRLAIHNVLAVEY